VFIEKKGRRSQGKKRLRMYERTKEHLLCTEVIQLEHRGLTSDRDLLHQDCRG
jgi:hypothetical protein